MKKTRTMRIMRNPRKGKFDMTEGQVKYQTVAENQRHNLEMEKLGQQEIAISKRNIAVKEAEEARAAALFPYQKKQVWSQTMSNLGSTVKSASEVANNIIKGARGLFGLFGDAASLGSNLGGMLGGGFYQGSLFA